VENENALEFQIIERLLRKCDQKEGVVFAYRNGIERRFSDECLVDGNVFTDNYELFPPPTSGWTPRLRWHKRCGVGAI
jgi:hypothetical protein